jgi:hypothetical protein
MINYLLIISFVFIGANCKTRKNKKIRASLEASASSVAISPAFLSSKEISYVNQGIFFDNLSEEEENKTTKLMQYQIINSLEKGEKINNTIRCYKPKPEDLAYKYIDSKGIVYLALIMKDTIGYISPNEELKLNCTKSLSLASGGWLARVGRVVNSASTRAQEALKKRFSDDGTVATAKAAEAAKAEATREKEAIALQSLSIIKKAEVRPELEKQRDSQLFDDYIDKEKIARAKKRKKRLDDLKDKRSQRYKETYDEYEENQNVPFLVAVYPATTNARMVEIKRKLEENQDKMELKDYIDEEIEKVKKEVGDEKMKDYREKLKRGDDSNPGNYNQVLNAEVSKRMSTKLPEVLGNALEKLLKDQVRNNMKTVLDDMLIKVEKAKARKKAELEPVKENNEGMIERIKNYIRNMRTVIFVMLKPTKSSPKNQE